jgi:hypothetical protein
LVQLGQERPDAAVIARLPTAKFVAYVTLEPIDSDRAAHRVLENAVRSLAKSNGGVWVDPLGNVYGHAEGAFE